jgi:AcrR family transcriptional regulator
MSRAETAQRLLGAAIQLGVGQGVGALSLQGIARTAGVSKALVLYHFGDKPALFAAIVERLGGQSAERWRAAATARDALEAWRELARAEAGTGELALLAALTQEGDVRDTGAVSAARAARETAAAGLGEAILRTVGLTPRVPVPLLGRVLVRHLDGLVLATAGGGVTAGEIDAELDTFTLALLGLGR